MQKSSILLCFCFALVMVFGCQYESTSTEMTVEASCGQCQFGLEGSGCDLAVRIDGKSYYVDGSSIDEHGDAHGNDGLCNCVRSATVTGEIKNGRFVATSFQLLPNDQSK